MINKTVFVQCLWRNNGYIYETILLFHKLPESERFFADFITSLAYSLVS